jgi:hypothetical protein
MAAVDIFWYQITLRVDVIFIRVKHLMISVFVTCYISFQAICSAPLRLFCGICSVFIGNEPKPSRTNTEERPNEVRIKPRCLVLKKFCREGGKTN